MDEIQLILQGAANSHDCIPALPEVLPISLPVSNNFYSLARTWDGIEDLKVR